MTGHAAHKQCRRIQVERTIDLNRVLPDKVSAEDPIWRQFTFDANRSLLRVRIDELAWVSFQFGHVEEPAIEGRAARPDGDVARRQHCSWRKCGNRRPRSRKPEAARTNRVGEHAGWSTQREHGLGVGGNFRIVYSVTAAQDGLRIAVDVIGKTKSRPKVIRVVSECLPVISQSEIKREISAHFPIILTKQRPEPFVDMISSGAETLRKSGNVGNRQR